VSLSVGLIGLGGVCLLLGLVALASRQPNAVWFPLVLAGALVTFILTFRLRRFQKHYEDLELRRMVSIDG
jgi:peptidoglycan/LPS O-acetylase OafA/YrhL